MTRANVNQWLLIAAAWVLLIFGIIHDDRAVLAMASACIVGSLILGTMIDLHKGKA